MIVNHLPRLDDEKRNVRVCTGLWVCVYQMCGTWRNIGTALYGLKKRLNMMIRTFTPNLNLSFAAALFSMHV